MDELPVIEADVVVIGSGAAGMTAALDLAPNKVHLLTKTGDLPSGSSKMAQGGIAAVVDPEDSAAAHAEDTLRVAVGLGREDMVRILTEEGPGRVRRLLAYGVPFDRDEDGRLAAQREAAHSHKRIIHADGDATGRALSSTLAKAVRAARHIDVHTHTFAYDLVLAQGRIAGVIAWRENAWFFYRCHRVVLATGGVGQAFSMTTNPRESTGDGLAMALRAGATASDLEFVQFHPTALAVDESADGWAPLLTEALRGAGAHLIDTSGRRFMKHVHPDAELAPRDVVARGVYNARMQTGGAYLDAREAVGEAFPQRFPTVYRLCRQAGFDPVNEPIPVSPAVHYHMGGVLTDADGRASLPGLWVCGETAATGVHGANRLASNSLLECLVFGHRVAEDIRSYGEHPPRVSIPVAPDWDVDTCIDAADIRRQVGDILFQACGLVRSGEAMRAGLAKLDTLGVGRGSVRAQAEVRNLILVGRAILTAALNREESRGAHYREDFPFTRDRLAKRSTLTLDDLVGVSVAQSA